MTFNLKLIQDFSLQERAMHELAKACWGNYSMPFVYCLRDHVKRRILSEFADSSHIRRHREAVLSNVSELFSVTLPNTLRDKLKIAVIRLQRGYREALACTEPYQYTHGLFIPNPLMAGPYSAKNFIDPSGHFDELAWAKRFVSDHRISYYSRFELACFFGFEESIRKLWSTIKKMEDLVYNGSFRYSGCFYDIEKMYGFPVVFWIYLLKDKFYDLYRLGNMYSLSFHIAGLKDAIDRSHEYAARFFWAGYSDAQKEEYLECYFTSDFKEMACFASKRNPGILNFFYSLLSLEQKHSLVSRMSNGVCAQIFSCLLLSSFYKTVLNDILFIPLPLQFSAFFGILRNLLDEMAEIPLLEYEEIFLAIWKCMYQAGIPLIDMFTPAIRNLIRIKAEGLLREIIQPLRHDEKLSILGDPRFWIKAEYLWNGDYDFLLRFLLFFMIDHDTVTQTFSLKGESIAVLCHIIETKFLGETIERPVSATMEIKKVVENIRESFEVLDHLLSQLDENPVKSVV